MTPGGRLCAQSCGGAAALCALAVALLLAAAAPWGAAPAAHGQEGAEGAAAESGGQGAAVRAPLPEARVPSVSVAIHGDGRVEVEHEVAGGSGARAVPLVRGDGGEGRPVDVEAVDADDGEPVAGLDISEDGSHAVVPPAAGGDLLLRYELEGAMRHSEPSTYSWSFLYRATTAFVLPDGVDLAFVNGQAVHFAGARAFNCHGCQMDLEFTVDEPRSVQRFELGGGGGGQDGGPRQVDVGVWTAAQVGPLALDPASMSIAYEAGGVSGAGGRWVTLVVPSELIGPPYRAEAGGKSAPVTTFDAGDGRIGISVRPAEDGQVRIFGSMDAAAAGAEGPGAEEAEEAGRDAQEAGGGGSPPPPASADPWMWGASAAIAAAAAAAVGYLAWARRRQGP